MLCWRWGRGSSRMLGGPLHCGENDPDMHSQHAPCGWAAATAKGREKRGSKGIGIELQRCCGRESIGCVFAPVRGKGVERSTGAGMCVHGLLRAQACCEGQSSAGSRQRAGYSGRWLCRRGPLVASQLMQASGWPARRNAPSLKVVVV